MLERWRDDEYCFVYEKNAETDKSSNWVNELLDYYFPDKETIELTRGKTRENFELMTTSGPELLWRGDEYGYVYEKNAETDKSPNWVNELLDYYFPDKGAIELVRGKTRIDFRFWRWGNTSKKVFPRSLIDGKLVG